MNAEQRRNIIQGDSSGSHGVPNFDQRKLNDPKLDNKPQGSFSGA